jgi:dTDP-4-amino-4,6-dideoxy-D-galactose acyltransferase
MINDIPSLQSLTMVLGNSTDYTNILKDAWQQASLNCKKISVGSAALWHSPDYWDSENFGVAVGKVTLVQGSDRSEISQVIKQLLQLKVYTYILFRIDQSYLEWVQVIEELDGILLDGSIDLFSATITPSEFKSEITVVPFAEIHREAIIEAAGSFQFGRFFTDPNFKLGKWMYAAWTNNALSGKAADSVWVAMADEKVLGFMALQKKHLGNKSYLYVPLIAKHPTATHKGVGKALLAHAQLMGHQLGYAGVALGTQTSNIPALRSYTQMGFYPYASEFTLRIFINK